MTGRYAILAFLVVVDGASAPSRPQGQLEAWVGKYPYERVGGLSFLQVPVVAGQLKRILPARRVRAVRETLTTVSPIAQRKAFLVMGGCRPHACPEENVILLFDLRDGSVVAVFFDRGKEEPVCFTSGPQLRDLPLEMKEIVLEGRFVRENASVSLYDTHKWIDNVACRGKP
jgi:hypothetical protein